jgi:HD superfamily phosphohydrolase
VQPNGTRIYHDPLHGAIALDRGDPTERLLITLIDTPAFQRLRRIRQLGCASLTFHGAEASRFTHSLGVMAIARRAFSLLTRRYPELQPYRQVVLCAALLHDLGHGPFSHTGEDIFGSHHEEWTSRILQESDPIAQALHSADPHLPDDLIAIYQKRHPVPLVWQLISSQLDCDRLDYLMRDSYFTGTSYGRLDLDRILAGLRYDPKTQELRVSERTLAAIEHYLVVRSFMYTQVYNHRKNVAATWGLKQAFIRARQLLPQGLEADDTVRAWLTQDCNQLPLATYLEADDGVFIYHLQRWRHAQDAVLQDLCRRYLDRDLFKALDVSQLDPQQQQQLLTQSLTKAKARQKPDPTSYVGLQSSRSRGYTLYHQGIMIETAQGPQEISEISPLVRALTQDQNRTWLIYPREIEPFP